MGCAWEWPLWRERTARWHRQGATWCCCTSALGAVSPPRQRPRWPPPRGVCPPGVGGLLPDSLPWILCTATRGLTSRSAATRGICSLLAKGSRRAWHLWWAETDTVWAQKQGPLAARLRSWRPWARQRKGVPSSAVSPRAALWASSERHSGACAVPRPAKAQLCVSCGACLLHTAPPWPCSAHTDLVHSPDLFEPTGPRWERVVPGLPSEAGWRVLPATIQRGLLPAAERAGAPCRRQEGKVCFVHLAPSRGLWRPGT